MKFQTRIPSLIEFNVYYRYTVEVRDHFALLQFLKVGHANIHVVSSAYMFTQTSNNVVQTKLLVSYLIQTEINFSDGKQYCNDVLLTL